MEGSSESGWRTSNSSRGLNTSSVSDRNPRLVYARSSLSGDVSHAFRFGKDRDRIPLVHMDHHKNQAVTPEWGDVSLRQWLDKPERSVDAVECLHVFRQIVEIVNIAHSQGILVHNVRPSCFIMSSFNLVSFIESASCSDSGSDSVEDGMNSETLEVTDSTSALPHYLYDTGNILESEDFQTERIQVNASQLASEASCMQSSSACATRMTLRHEKEHQIGNSMNAEKSEDERPPFPMKQVLQMETNWYTSPEEVTGAPSSFASDIYRLGVLLFELFCPFTSREEKNITMSSLRHRVLPPQLLLNWPKEASFCLWLLHPEPSSRPQMGALLCSEFLNEARNNFEEREAAIELRERTEEQELLLEFLLLLQQRKVEAADKLQETISLVNFDIEEVAKLQPGLKDTKGSFPELTKEDLSASDFPINEDSTSMGSRKRFRPGSQILSEECDDNTDDGQKSDAFAKDQDNVASKSYRVMKNFKKLEVAYFGTRLRLKSSGKPLPRNSSTNSDGRGSIVVTERSSANSLLPKERYGEGRPSGWISPFLEGLCKYLSFSKLKVKADLKQGDLLNSSNLVCSLSFDRDGEFFATAGVNKKIKVFECDSILNEDRDIHYPVVEMASRSKLSSICWNSYIKSQIASSNFEGVVQVWDATRSQVVTEMKEHERRVWSIDFSSADPTLLASGSDDGSVKIWSINQAILFLHLVDVSFETKRS